MKNNLINFMYGKFATGSMKLTPKQVHILLETEAMCEKMNIDHERELRIQKLMNEKDMFGCRLMKCREWAEAYIDAEAKIKRWIEGEKMASDLTREQRIYMVMEENKNSANVLLKSRGYAEAYVDGEMAIEAKVRQMKKDDRMKTTRDETIAVLTDLSKWCEAERGKLGVIDGYSKAGEEFGIRRVELQIEKKLHELTYKTAEDRLKDELKSAGFGPISTDEVLKAICNAGLQLK